MFIHARTILFGLLAILLCTSCADKNPPRPGYLFGTPASASVPSPQKLPLWEQILVEEQTHPVFIQTGFAPGITPAGELTAQRIQEWNTLAASLRGQPLLVQAKAVNTFFNHWPFKQDTDLWGKEDVWATPREFLAHGGDCEDYAAIKYFALRSLGAEPKDLHIAVVYDRRRREGHAVLAVYADAVAYILDNRSSTVKNSEEYRRYVLYYTVNENSFRLYR